MVVIRANGAAPGGWVDQVVVIPANGPPLGGWIDQVVAIPTYGRPPGGWIDQLVGSLALTPIQAELVGHGGRFGASRDVELREDAGDVDARGALADEERLADLAVRSA